MSHLSIPRKLLLGYLAFVFPLGIVIIFMVAGFVSDIRTVNRELLALDYADRVLQLHYSLTRLEISEAFGSDAEPFRSETLLAADRLEEFHDEHGRSLGLTAQALRQRGRQNFSAPGVVGDIRERLSLSGRANIALADSLPESLLILSDIALDQNGVTQDPALDSNALIRAILVHLPEVQRTLGDTLLAISRYSAPSGQETQMRMMALQTYAVVLRDSTHRYIGNLIELAMREDRNVFGAHPDVMQLLGNELDLYQAASDEFVDLLVVNSSEANTEAVQGVQLGIAVLERSQSLFDVGVEGIRTLVADRPLTIRKWLIIAGGSSAAAILLVSLLVGWISRSITRSVRGIIDYTRQVANGDHAATLHAQLPDDLFELYGHTRSMVDDISALAEFPRRNPNGVLSAGDDGEVIYRNPSVQQFMDEHGVSLDALLPSVHRELVARLLKGDTQGQLIETEGDTYVLEWSYYAVRESRVVHIYFTDITERKRAEQQLLHDSFHDSLTGLPNRALFADRLEQTISILRTERRYTFAVFMIDLDRFKVINDSLGHDAGDELLRTMAERIRSATRPPDTVARFGGDEFGVLLPGLDDSKEALHIADRIHARVREPVMIAGQPFSLTCSIGIVFPGNDRREAENGRHDPHVATRTAPEILRDADSAMYSAKAAGKSRSEIFNSTMYETAIAAMKLETQVRRAVANDEITTYYQPIVSLETGRIAGFEALVRWHHPDRGVVLPGEFIPLAEETGVIVEIGHAVLGQAARQACAWKREHPSSDLRFMSVNLSVRQFTHPTLIEDVKRVLDEVGMEAHCLKLEVTESGLMQNVESSLGLLTRLKELDITLGIDDFGTGYSSLSYLHRFPFDTLKVDQSFVGQMEQERESREIVTNVLSLAHGLGKETIAEGIETENQLAELRKLNAEFGQGYLFSRPLPAEQISELLSQDPRW